MLLFLTIAKLVFDKYVNFSIWMVLVIIFIILNIIMILIHVKILGLQSMYDSSPLIHTPKKIYNKFRVLYTVRDNINWVINLFLYDVSVVFLLIFRLLSKLIDNRHKD